MATLFLLESKIKWNPLLPTTSPNRRFPMIKPTNFSIDLIKFKSCTQTSRFHKPSSSNLLLNCTFMNNSEYPLEDDEIVNSLEMVARTITEVLKALKKPAITGVLLLGLLLLWDCSFALAASGGRMGGSSFTSSSSSSSGSSSSSSSSGSYSSSSSSSGSYSSGSDWSSCGSGSYSSGSGSRGSSTASDNDGGSSKRELTDAEIVEALRFWTCLVALIVMWCHIENKKSELKNRISVLKLQVGLLGTARSLQSDLNQIAETADTSSKKGFSYVLTETVVALLRHPDYCVSGYSSVDVKPNMNEGEQLFKKLVIEERGKFDEETLVNVDNIKKQTSSSQQANEFSNEYIVITILVAAQGVHKLPTINSTADLKEALQKLGSIPLEKTLGVEVLWTPQDENDTLTDRELVEDYSLLRPL